MSVEGTVEHIAQCHTCGAQEFQPLELPTRWIGRSTFQPVRSSLGLCRCSQCGFTFVNPRPARALLGAFYGSESYDCHDVNDTAGTQRKAEFLLDLIQSQKPDARRILDFGCGGGLLLRRALQRKLEAVGYDVGDHAMRTCRAQGLQVTDRLEDLPRGHFDVIVLHHVFEHVSDHAEVLEHLARLLSPHGSVFIEVPNVGSLRARLSHPLLSKHLKFDERYRAYPIHLSYFDATTLPALLQRHGYVTTHVTTYGLGLDELIANEASETEAYDTPLLEPGKLRSLIGQRARDLVKRTLYGANLGENLLVVAHPEPSRRALVPSRAKPEMQVATG